MKIISVITDSDILGNTDLSQGLPKISAHAIETIREATPVKINDKYGGENFVYLPFARHYGERSELAGGAENQHTALQRNRRGITLRDRFDNAS
jgi:hypothetical protein